MSQETGGCTIQYESTFSLEAVREGSFLWQQQLPDYAISVVGSFTDIDDRKTGIMFYIEQRLFGNFLTKLPGQFLLLRQGNAPVGRFLKRSTPVDQEFNLRFRKDPTFQDVVYAEAGQVVYTVLYGDMPLVRITPVELVEEQLGFSVEVLTEVSYDEFTFENRETVEFEVNGAVQVQSMFRDSATLTLVQRYIQNEEITSVDVVRCQFSKADKAWVSFSDGDLSQIGEHRVFSTMSGLVHGTYLTLRRSDEVVGNVFMQLILEEGVGYLRVFKAMKK